MLPTSQLCADCCLPSPLSVALPTLDIGEGALDKIFALYKELLPVGGYLTYAEQLNRPHFEVLMKRLAELEQETLEQRAQVLP